MEGKELLKSFRHLPEPEQNRILTAVFMPIAEAHSRGKAYATFSWRDCRLLDGNLIVDVAVSEPLDDDSRTRNYKDYAALIYCLATGSSSAESMNWDAGRTIKSAVLREIVLTLCGRNTSIEPLIGRLSEPYVDEEAFFDGMTTVDEKEGLETCEKQRRIEAQNRASEAEQTSVSDGNVEHIVWPRKSSWDWEFILMVALAIGAGKACQYYNGRQQHQSVQQMQQPLEEQHQIRESLRNVEVAMPFRAKQSDSDSTEIMNE